MRILLILFLAGFISVASVLLYYYNEVRFEADKLIHYNPKLTTQIFDRNGDLIANIFDREHRIYAKFDEIPSRVIEALVAIEDTMFFEHIGVNFDAILRAIIKDIKAGKLVEGASTLTQQLVKTTLLTREKKISRKIKEAILSLKIEFELSKEEILERYLNHIYFGHGYYGIKTAAFGYFRKDLKDLTIKEIAILVGLPKAPSFYDPTRNLEFALSRANRVLFRLNSLGWLNDSEFEYALREEPKIYDDTLTLNRSPYVVDEVIKELKPKFPDLKSGGYKIYTTIDLKLQNIAKEALKNGYDKILERDEKRKYTSSLNGALVSIESSTGEILSLVGGISYRDSKFNRATQSNRQPGSSFKPFLYQIALDLGYSVVTPITDISRTYEFKTEDNEDKLWQPKNYEKDFKGLIPLKEALIHSRNLATINLVEDIGLYNIYDILTNSYGFEDIPENLSISLGTFGLSPLDMSKFYSLFANYGEIVEPILVKAIESRFSQRISFETKKRRVTSREQAFLMTSILRDVVRSGTGRSVYSKEIEIAGKTGTTNRNVDAWFCGYSPTIETIVWFGNDDNSRMGRLETGGRASGVVVKEFFEGLVELYPETERVFEVPDGVIKTKVGGDYEFFTDISKPPISTIESEEELIF